MPVEPIAVAAAILAGGWFWWMRARSRDAEADLRRIAATTADHISGG